jgi:Na+-transporting methylmalonyl-CoA/oxaloacetate decarboxylase gamma subunit
MEFVDQAIGITVVGMGLTFAAIGLLVAAMIALTRWTRGREETTTSQGEPSASIPGHGGLAELEQAAAVAVAVALAQAARVAQPTYAWHAARSKGEPSSWQAYARSQHLDRRDAYRTSKE